MLTKEQKPDSVDNQNPAEADYQKKFDREFADIAKNYSDETEHPLGDKESGVTNQDSLANKEKGAESTKPSAESISNAPESSFYNATASKGAFAKLKGINLFEDKKKTGGILGAFIAIVAAIILGISSLGPLQFIHFAQMLHSFHLSDQEYNGNSRLRKLIIYAKNNGDTSKTRLSMLEGKYSNKIDAKLAKNGWNIDFKSGTFDGFTYDPDKIDSDSKLSAEEMKSKLEAEGVKNVEIKDGKVNVPPDSMKYWSNKSLIKQIYSGSSRDIGRITGAFEKRILIKRSGISLNPVTKLDQKINKKIGDFISEERAKRLAGKAITPDIITQANADPDNPDNTNESAANEAQQGVDEAKSGKLKSAADLSFKGAAGLGIVCAVKAISDGASEAKKLNATIPLIQASAEVLAVGSKTQDGGDVSMRVLSEYSKSLYGRTEDNKSSWSQSSTLQYEQTGSATGTRLPDEFNPSDQETGLTSFFGSIPLLGEVCSAVTSTVGSIVISIATGGLVSVVSDQIIDKLIQASGIFNTLITYLAGEVPNLADPVYAGAVYGEAANVGTRILANETASTMGGRVLSDTEELALNNAMQTERIAEYKNKPLVEKYLDPYQYDTPVAKAIDSINPNSAASAVASLPQTVFASITAPFSKKVSAADEDTTPSEVYYGYKKVGFAAGSLDAPELENPYKNAEKALEVLQDGKYVNMLKECNKVEVLGLPDGPLDFTTESGTGEAPAIIDQSKLPDYCKEETPSGYPDAIIVRTAAFDTMKMKAFACIEFDDEQSCKDIGLGNTDAEAQKAGSIRIATFNVLGNGHTEAKGKAANWPVGATRMESAFQIMQSNNFSVVGLQEFEAPQREKFLELAGSEWAIFPNPAKYTNYSSSNSIVWKSAEFDLVASGYDTELVYFGNNDSLDAPWVKLKHKITGEEYYIKNTHDPVGEQYADLRLKNAKRHREDALSRIEAGEKVIITGDFNSAEKIRDADAGLTRDELTYCVLTKGGKLFNAYDTVNGGDGADCPTKSSGEFGIDHVYHDSTIAVTNWGQIEGLEQQKITDHPVVYADISVGGTSKGGWVWPIEGASASDVSNGWGDHASKGIHKAIDIPADNGTDVLAAHNGVVAQSYYSAGCGYFYLIKASGTDYWMSYQHLQTLDTNKRVGDAVTAGEKIGKVGEYCGSGYHLHFGIEVQPSISFYSSPLNNSIDPLKVLP